METDDKAIKKKKPGLLKRSLGLRFTVTFILITVLVILTSIFLSLEFLEPYYISQKKDTVIEVVDGLNTIMYENGFGDDSQEIVDVKSLKESLSEYMRKYWRQDNINLMILNTNGTILYGIENGMQDLQSQIMQYLFQSELDTNEIYQGDSYEVFVFNDNRRARNRYMQAVGYLSGDCPFVLSMPMEAIRESTMLSNRFYILIGICLVLLAALGIYVSTRHMVRPIEDLSRIAGRMADLDFDARADVASVDELGKLGLSINHMADELERTYRQLKDANEQLTKDIEEKEKIDEMRKEFISNVSHELKTPIAIIQGYAEGLMDCVNEDEESRSFYSEVIMDEAMKMNRMVLKLIDLNRLEFGESQMEMTEFSLSDLTEGVMEACALMVEGVDGKISFENLAGDVYVHGDEFMIEEVLRNYLSNSCHHLSGRKEIIIREATSGEGRIRLSVYNSGQAIPEDALDLIWTKFYKVDKARTRQYGGSGIGLSIVKAIMEQHGCPYGVYNEKDGVVFWFELRQVDGEQDD